MSIVHRQGKVLAQLGQRHVYAITSAEKGRTHTVLLCISASGMVLPPNDGNRGFLIRLKLAVSPIHSL